MVLNGNEVITTGASNAIGDVFEQTVTAGIQSYDNTIVSENLKMPLLLLLALFLFK